MQTIPTPAVTPDINITDKTICISLEFGRIGNSKKVSTAEIEVNADSELIAVSKKLLKSKELAAIVKHDAETAEWVKNRSVPSMFRRGVYLVKLEAVEQIENYLQERSPQRDDLIQAFLEVYDAQKGEAEQHLRDVYDPTDYPPRGVVASRFAFEWSWIAFNTPTKLKEISTGFWEMEKAKAAAKFENATENAKLLLRVQMKELVDHLVERMTPGEDGKRRIFKSTTLSNITEFLDTFSLRNITSDSEMEYLVTQAKSLLNGVDPETLRKSDVDAECLATGFGTVKKFLDDMVTTAGSRKITFDQEAEEESNPFA